MSGSVPAGTERVILTDDRGVAHVAELARGVWSVDWFCATALVRCEDRDGEILARSLPAGQRARIRDAPEPCPVCAAVAWVHVNDWVLCECCGHAAGVALRDEPGPLSPNHYPVIQTLLRLGEFEADTSEDPWLRFDENWQEQLAEHLAGVEFRVYGMPGKVVSARPQTKYDITVSHQELSYEITANDHNLETSDALESELTVITTPLDAPRVFGPFDSLVGMVERPDDRQDRSLGALLVAEAHHHRRCVAQAEIRVQQLMIDGRQEPFELLALGDAWVASRDYDEVHIQVHGFLMDPRTVMLEPVTVGL